MCLFVTSFDSRSVVCSRNKVFKSKKASISHLGSASATMLSAALKTVPSSAKNVNCYQFAVKCAVFSY